MEEDIYLDKLENVSFFNFFIAVRFCYKLVT